VVLILSIKEKYVRSILRSTSLSAYSCQKISSPFIIMFKQKSKLSSGFPNVGLFSPHLHNIIELSSYLLRDHISTLYNLLNSRSSIRSLYIARLKSLQSTLWLPFSPLDLVDWSPFIKHKCIKNDFLAQTLIAARSLSINFSSSLPSNNLTVTGGYLPIINLIPSIYAMHITSLKFKTLLFLSQLVSEDGTYLLTWLELRHLHIVYNKGGQPRWYKALCNTVCSPNSFRLLPQYVIPERFSIDLPLPLIPLNKKCKSAWAAHWSDSSDSIIYGRIIVSYPLKCFAVLAHWIPVQGSANLLLTPASRQASFMRCPGCSIGINYNGKLTQEIKKKSHNATCFKQISLHTTLIMHGNVSRLAADMDEVHMNATFHTIETQLSAFGKRFDILPDYTPALVDPIECITPFPTTSNQVAHSLNNDNTPTPYRFYTDGSLSNLGTNNIRLGYGWLQLTDDDLIVPEHCNVISSTWPSSTKAELSAIISIIELEVRSESGQSGHPRINPSKGGLQIDRIIRQIDRMDDRISDQSGTGLTKNFLFRGSSKAG